MSEYNLVCLNCFHGPHANGPCVNCLSPNVCMEFVRADIFAARALHGVQQQLGYGLSNLTGVLSATFELLSRAFPEATAQLRKEAEEREEANKKAEAEAQAKKLEEANQAYTEAREAELSEDIIESARKASIVPFSGSKKKTEQEH